MKSIHDLKLHETIYMSTIAVSGSRDGALGFYVTRVPGGWVYSAYNESKPVFVPFHTEFKDINYNDY